jgi:predicted nuclease of predicted toxin-antitoxin system
VTGWLVDNNVPRSVTLLLRDHGQDAAEVRDALAHDAPDVAVVAYAASQNMWLITHDRGCARLALKAAVPHVWLRTPEPRDADRLRELLDEVIPVLERGVVRVTLFLGSVRQG